MKPGPAALFAFLAVAVAIGLVEAVSLGGQIAFRMRGASAYEIRWMEGLEPLRVAPRVPEGVHLADVDAHPEMELHRQRPLGHQGFD